MAKMLQIFLTLDVLWIIIQMFFVLQVEERMMRSQIVFGIICGSLFATVGLADSRTQIRYTSTEMGLGRWQNWYEVMNNSLPVPIEEFTIWFDVDLYDTLAVEGSGALSDHWNMIVWQRDSVLTDAGGYDAKVLSTGIIAGESVSGFGVSFDWLGTGMPGPQPYEIIDPVTFERIDSGITVPEPGTLCVFGLGGMLLLRKRLN